MDVALFAMLFEGIGPPIIQTVDAMVAALQGWMRPVLVSGVVLYAVGRMIWATLRGDGNPFGDSLAIMISGSIFIYAATEAAGLGPQARNLLLNGVSNEIGRTILGVGRSRQLMRTSSTMRWPAPGRPDSTVYNKLPTFSLKAWALAVLVVFYWIFAFGCVAVRLLHLAHIWASRFSKFYTNK